MGHIHRLQRRILPHTNSQSVQEVHAFLPPGSVLPVQSPTLWSIHSSHGVHSGGQRGQTHGTSKGYKDPPVPRRLAGESLYPRHLSPAYSNPGLTLSGTRVAGEQGEVRTGSQTGVQLHRLPVQPERGQGQTYRGTLADLNRQDQINTVGSGLPGPAIHVPHRSTHSNRKASPLRATTHETHTVALEKQLEGPRITGKGDPGTQVPPPPSKVMAGGKQCAIRSTITPSKTYSADIYRHIKRRVGRSLKRADCKGNLVPSREQTTHKPLRAKSSVSSSKRVSNPLLQQNSTDSYRQHNSGCLYQQRGMKSGSPCALLWRILSWCTRQQVTLKARHIPGLLNVIADKLSRLSQTIQTEWSLHPEVFSAVCSKPQVDLCATRFNNKLPQFVSPVPDPQAWAVDALSLSWEDLDPYAFSLAAILGKVVEKLHDYPFNQDMLKRWERAAREQLVMCNQAAGLSRCFTRVQDAMSSQLKTLHLDKKGKSCERTKQAVDELDYLVTFNRSISQAMARTMQDLSEGVFVSMANFTLTRRDSYLEYLHAVVKHDTLNTLSMSPVHCNSLFPDQLITKAEEEICRSEYRRSVGQSHRRQGRFHPYSSTDKSTNLPDRKSGVPAWKQIRDKQQSRKGRGKTSTFSQQPAKGSKPCK